MPTKRPKKKPFHKAVDSAVLEARATAKAMRAHIALEREIVRLMKQLERRVDDREMSLNLFARVVLERHGLYTVVPTPESPNGESV